MKSLKLRKWQEEAIIEIGRKLKSEDTTAIINACPAAGKTIMAVIAAKVHFPDWEIIVVSPSVEIQENWANKFNIHGSLDIDYKYSFKYGFHSDYQGVSITYQSLNLKNTEFLSRQVNEKTLIIADEVHHMGDQKTWGDNFKIMAECAGFVLLLTGTPFRSDRARIPFCEYIPTPEGFKIVTDYDRTAAEELKENNICPIEFNPTGIIHNGVDIDVLQEDSTGNAHLREVLRNTDYLYEHMYRPAQKILLEKREGSNAGGLFVCIDIETANKMGELISNSIVVTSDDPQSNKKIKTFRDSQIEWIIAVKMVAEGVDIDRLRVGVYATNHRTKLILDQITNRVTRNPEDWHDFANWWMPKHITLMDYMTNYTNAVKHIIKNRTPSPHGGGGGSGEQQPNQFAGDIYDGYQGQKINNEFTFSLDLELQTDEISERYKVPSELVRFIYSEANKERDVKEPLKTKTERVTNLKKEINKKANKLAYALSVEVKEIHIRLNRTLGIFSSSGASEDVLVRKLNLVNLWMQEQI